MAKFSRSLLTNRTRMCARTERERERMPALSWCCRRSFRWPLLVSLSVAAAVVVATALPPLLLAAAAAAAGEDEEGGGEERDNDELERGGGGG